MELEKDENIRLVESVAVIDIDPCLNLFRPNCTLIGMAGRIKMAYEYRAD